MKKIGDIVQVRRGSDWLYAALLSLPAGGDMGPARVQIQHPGNPEDGEVLMAYASDMRVKEDVQALIDKVAPIVANPGQHGIGEARIRQLAALDPFWESFLPPSDGRLTEHHSRHLGTQQTTMHKNVLAHYQNMLKRLT
jgi:hypothetical protein